MRSWRRSVSLLVLLVSALLASIAAVFTPGLVGHDASSHRTRLG